MENRPTIGLGCLIFREKKVLLGKRIGGKAGNGFFAGPGGSLDFGETLEEGILREIKEEVGIQIKNLKFLCVGRNSNFPTKVNLAFTAEWESGEAKTIEPDKCEGWDWYDLEGLPSPLLSVTETNIKYYKNNLFFYDI